MAPIKLPKHVASNKPQTPTKSPIEPSKGEGPQAGPIPFIDKISIVVIPPSQSDANEMYKALYTALDEPWLFASGTVKASGYKISKRLILKSVVDAKRYPLLQFSVDDNEKLVKKVRIEFVPVDLGKEGMDEFRCKSAQLFDFGWEFVVKHGHLTRLDVTVDVAGIRMNQFLFLPEQLATTSRWVFKGKLQSYYSGKSLGNQTKIYDRKAKRLAQGKPWVGGTVVRIERKLTKLNKLKLSEIYEIPNPFEKMIFTQFLPKPPPAATGKKWVWHFFCDSVRVRGLVDALALLPKDQRAKYKKHIASQGADWWDPAKLWQGWASMLDELGIAKPDIY